MPFFRKDPAVAAGEALYAAAVEQARAEPLYADFGVPDTVEGRFEMVTLHVYLILRRLKGGAPGAREAGQKLFDAMFQDMDRSLRELGVGDLSVARKIRALAENFYGRVAVFEDALRDDAPPEMLDAALGRNVYEDETSEEALRLARYVRAAADAVAAQPLNHLIGGAVRFPAAEASL